MSFSLSGKNVPNKNNLSGKNNPLFSSIPFEIKKLKLRIMNTFILPLLSKQWKKIQDNLFLLDQIQEKLRYYYESYNLEDIKMYQDILSIFEILVQQHIQLEDMETKLYGKNGSEPIIHMIYRTTMIKLKPEYELYDNILGKPKREENQTYREDIIQDIQKWMIMEKTNYEKIQKNVLDKYECRQTCKTQIK